MRVAAAKLFDKSAIKAEIRKNFLGGCANKDNLAKMHKKAL